MTQELMEALRNALLAAEYAAGVAESVIQAEFSGGFDDADFNQPFQAALVMFKEKGGQLREYVCECGKYESDSARGMAAHRRRCGER